VSRDEEFVEFARDQAAGLRRTAFLLCRDWHLAQDLTQTALAKLYVAWGRVHSADSAGGYARTVLLRVFLDHQRRRSTRETVLEHPPDGLRDARVDPEPELRLTLLDALGRLSPRDRAIVVLRYWEDHSVDSVAAMLGISPSVVKTQSMRCLARLRELLGEDLLA
jgi:RNA polymerase sigma-70 factor (sigma-E family)